MQKNKAFLYKITQTNNMMNRILLVLTLLAAHYTLSAASLNLIKTVDNATPLSGETFTYTLQYRCASTTENCTGVMITDPLPASVEYVSLAGSIHTTNAVYSSSTRTVTFTFQDPLAAGTVGQVSITVRFPNGTTPNGTVANNTATISGSNASAVSSSAYATASASDKFTTSKYYSGGVPGQYMSYGFELCNAGGNGSLNIPTLTLIDNLPANTVFHSATYGGVYNSSLHRVIWMLTDLNIDECEWPQVILTFPASTFSAGNSITNTGNITYTPYGGSPKTANPSLTHQLQSPWFGSYIDKNGATSMYRGIGGYSHNFEYYNDANLPIDNFYIEDLFPAGLQPKSFQTGSFYMVGPYNTINKYVKYQTNLNSSWTGISANPIDPWTNTTIQTSSLGLASNEYITGLRWEFGPDPWPIGSGLSGNIVITYETIASTATLGTFTNCITAGGTNVPTMNYYGDRCLDYEIKVPLTNYTPSPQKSYTSPNNGGNLKSSDVTGDWFAVGNNVGFRLRLRNTSSAGASIPAPAIADLLPEGLVYVNNSWTYDDDGTGFPAPTFVKTLNYKGTGRTHLRWDWPSTVNIQPGQEVYIFFYATITNTAAPGEDAVRNEYAILNDIQNWCSFSGEGDDAVDVNDIDNDGNTTEQLCFGYADIDIIGTPALSSVKYIKGQLDPTWTKYPNYGNAVPGGIADYRLVVKNDGNIPIKEIKIVDILPFVGDKGVIDLSNRNSRWRPNLAGAVSAPFGVTVYYSTAENPCRSAEGIEPNGPSGCQTPNWSTSPPSDITTVQSLKFDFGNLVLAPADSLELEWPMRAPVNVLSSLGALPDSIAWASFGFIGTRVDNNAQLLAAEPFKVGMRVDPFVPPVIGDFVWLDTNQDGILNNGEVGLNGVKVELYEDNGDGIANPNTDNLVTFTVTANNGYYLFPNLDGQNFFMVFYLPPNYNISPNDQGSNDAEDSDGTLSSYQGNRIAITPVTNISVGEIDLDWDLGLYPNDKASVGNYIWIDNNNDGIQNESASFGVNNMTINLYKSSNLSTPYATTQSRNDLDGNLGFYLFEELTAGNYLIEFVSSGGATLTTQGPTGSSDASDSDVNPTTFRSEVFNLSINEYDETWDIGLTPGTVEVCNNGTDDDGDGLIDCADSGCKPIISSVSMQNITCANPNSGQISITASGSGTLTYSIANEPSFQVNSVFTNLGTGLYTVRVKNDAGCTSTYTANIIRLESPPCIEICNDGIDNDGDGKVDCDDEDCDAVGGAGSISKD